jgi:excisionase family DNA binding protein
MVQRRQKIQQPAGASVRPGRQDKPSSRLLGVHEAARYLSVSHWAVRDVVRDGTLKAVRLPPGSGRDLRRLLLDRRDLDAVIERSKA